MASRPQFHFVFCRHLICRLRVQLVIVPHQLATVACVTIIDTREQAFQPATALPHHPTAAGSTTHQERHNQLFSSPRVSSAGLAGGLGGEEVRRSCCNQLSPPPAGPCWRAPSSPQRCWEPWGKRGAKLQKQPLQNGCSLRPPQFTHTYAHLSTCTEPGCGRKPAARTARRRRCANGVGRAAPKHTAHALTTVCITSYWL